MIDLRPFDLFFRATNYHVKVGQTAVKSRTSDRQKKMSDRGSKSHTMSEISDNLATLVNKMIKRKDLRIIVKTCLFITGKASIFLMQFPKANS